MFHVTLFYSFSTCLYPNLSISCSIFNSKKKERAQTKKIMEFYLQDYQIAFSLSALSCVTLCVGSEACVFVSSVLFQTVQTHRHTWTHAQKLIWFHCCLPRSLALADPLDFASHGDASCSHLSPSPWPVAPGCRRCIPRQPGCRAGGGACLQHGCSLEALLMD